MSIQILPPKTSVSEQIGKSLAPAMAQGAEQQFQRGQIQQALQNLKIPEGATAFDATKALISAFAGIPGAEKYIEGFLPFFLQQMQTQASFQPGATQPSTQTSLEQAPVSEYFGKPLTETAMQQQAKQYALQTGTGNEGFNEKFTQLLALNESAQAKRQSFEKAARERFPELQKHPELYSRFFETAQKFPKETDPERLLEKTYREFQTEIADLTKLAARDFSRIKDFNSLAPILSDLEKKGLGTQARAELVAKGLKPYQFSHLFNPISAQQKSELKKLPPAALGKGDPNARMREFLEKNIDSDSPLPTIAMDLHRKGYAWDQIGPMMRSALGERITKRQDIDLGDIETGEFRFPSMQEIFRPETSATGLR